MASELTVLYQATGYMGEHGIFQGNYWYHCTGIWELRSSLYCGVLAIKVHWDITVRYCTIRYSVVL